MLDPPGLKRVYERSKHERAHNVLCQLALAEGTVPAVVAHHKELQHPYWLQPWLLKTHVTSCMFWDALMQQKFDMH